MRFYLDTCSVYKGVLVVEGWSEKGPPAVVYAGSRVEARAYPTDRPDLTPHFGEGTSSWGFTVKAILTGGNAKHEDIALVFPDGTEVKAPGRQFRSPENAALDSLLRRFTEASRAGDRVLEIGSRARSGNTYRHLVHPGADYTGLDISPGPNVDIVGDAHHLSRHVGGVFDAVFSISVFEHLVMPWMTALEMNRVMRVGALGYVQSHPAWPLHEEPWDFWRFSKDAWDGLFNAHTGFEMLGKEYGMGATVVPNFAEGGHMQGLDGARSFLLSACLVRKVGEPKVRWEAEASEVYDLGYDHA